MYWMQRLSFLALALASLPSAAQDGDIVAPPTVWIAPQAGLQPIRLESVAIDVRTAGFLARTRIELSFHNPNDRVLEGEFVFPLGPGQTVSGYALEVEGKLREGVVVPKETARIAFEDITRQQVDPGLAELTRGNVFRTRLYPIPARGSKRIALSFEQAMPVEAGHYRYLLPLAFREPVERFTVDVAAEQATQPPVGAGPELRFDRAGAAWTAQLRREDVQPQRELAFRIPVGADDADLLQAVDPLQPIWRSVVARVDSGRLATLAPAAKPGRIALFFDASGSASGRDLARERAALQRYFSRLRDVQVDLVAFRDAAEAPRRFRISGGNADALIEALAELPLDGGSSYGAIDLAAVAGADLVLIVGDGLSNFGGHRPTLRGPAGQAPMVHLLSAAQRADHVLLARIAAEHGGQYLDLLQIDAEAAAMRLVEGAWRLLAVDVEAGSCEGLLPRAGVAVGGSLTLTGRCTAPTRIALRFGDGLGASALRSLTIGAARPADSAIDATVHRLRAQAEINDLAAAPRPDIAKITDLGTRYAVVTEQTSLLVLDRIEDYLRYGIEPAEADLKALYRERLPSWPKREVDPGRESRLSQLAQRWQEFRDWHAQRHPWLETLLQPAAEAELQAWRAFAGGKAIDAGIREADALRARSAALAARWLEDGADDKRRAAWEREATDVMLALDALRERRAALPPEIALARRENEQGLDRIAVTGSRVAGEAQRMREMAPAPTVAPSPASAPAMELAAAPPAQRADASERDERKAEGAGGSGAPAQPRARIALKGWDPDTPYLRALREASDPYRAYLGLRGEHGETPTFFLDAADFFRSEAKDAGLAQRVLSNLAELDVENTALTRVLAYRLAQWDLYALAVGQFEDALLQRPEEPQSYRDLALALARQPAPDVDRAIALLWTVASGEWHGRFPDIEVIALHELNDVLAGADPAQTRGVAALGIPRGLLGPVDTGLRVIMTWDADNTDIDLWVIDPTGEETYYGRNRSRAGGHVSRDFTQGYGPEVYTIARPLPGTYRVRAHYFGDRRQSLTGPVTVQIEFQTGFGRGAGAREAITRRLESGRDWIDLGEFVVGR